MKATETAPVGSPGPGSPELVVLVGLPGSGKTTFARRFASTHRVVSPDASRLSNKAVEDAMRTALAAGQSVVVDRIHATVASRARTVALGRAGGARLVAYVVDVPRPVCLERNRARQGRSRVPDVAIYAAAARLARPSEAEGFDAVWRVGLDGSLRPDSPVDDAS